LQARLRRIGQDLAASSLDCPNVMAPLGLTSTCDKATAGHTPTGDSAERGHRSICSGSEQSTRQEHFKAGPSSVHGGTSENTAALAADIQGPQTVISPYLQASAAEQAGSDKISILGPGHLSAHRSTAAHAIRTAADKQEALTQVQGGIAAIAVDRSGWRAIGVPRPPASNHSSPQFHSKT